MTAVLFVAALSEYNQTLFEDNSQNRLTESLTLFGEICNTKYLSNTAMMLFLNKRDIFAEKIADHPLSTYFPAYKGRNEFGEAAEWIQLQFQQKNPNPDRQIYAHITCATDKNNVKMVFEVCKDIILRQAINTAFGL